MFFFSLYSLISQRWEVDIAVKLSIQHSQLNTIYQIMLQHILIDLSASNNMDIAIRIVLCDMNQA